MLPSKRRFPGWKIYSLPLCVGIGCMGIGAVAMGCKQVAYSFNAQTPSAQTPSAQTPLIQKSTDSEPLTAMDTHQPLNAYQRLQVAGAVVHVVEVPAAMSLSVAVSDDLTPVAQLAQRENAVYAINAGFFDPQNGQTTSHLTVQGQVVGDPASNERLVGNPALSEYLEQIFNRSEFRSYRCDVSERLSYDISSHRVPTPEGCVMESAVGAGPVLLPEDGAFAEAFTDYTNDDPENGDLIRDAIGGMQRNARSAIGIAGDQMVLMMVEKNADSVGMTLVELAEFARSQNIQKLLNLDGGSSSSLYVNEGDESAIYFGRSDEAGNPVERAVKSVIIVK